MTKTPGKCHFHPIRPQRNQKIPKKCQKNTKHQQIPKKYQINTQKIPKYNVICLAAPLPRTSSYSTGQIRAEWWWPPVAHNNKSASWGSGKCAELRWRAEGNHTQSTSKWNSPQPAPPLQGFWFRVFFALSPCHTITRNETSDQIEEKTSEHPNLASARRMDITASPKFSRRPGSTNSNAVCAP